jgi:hypothetical protein
MSFRDNGQEVAALSGLESRRIEWWPGWLAWGSGPGRPCEAGRGGAVAGARRQGKENPHTARTGEDLLEDEKV